MSTHNCKVSLTCEEIEAILPKVAEGLGQYLAIQCILAKGNNIARNDDFRRLFNRFFRIRRKQEWQSKFYDLMDSLRRCSYNELPIFESVLLRVKSFNGNIESSYTSKLLASIDTTLPIIDSIVLKHFKLRLPPSGSLDRIARISQIYDTIRKSYHVYLQTKEGKYLVERFKSTYPHASISKVKMLDFIIWQKRA